MRLKLFAAFLFSSLVAVAQPDSLDNIVYKTYGNWKALPNNNYRQFTFTGTDNSYCVVTIYQSRPSEGNKNLDFNAEWAERVEKNFTVFSLSAPKLLKNKNGNAFQRLGAKATDKAGNSFYVQLNVFDCNKAIQSVLVISANQKQLQQYDSSWQNLITVVRKNRVGITTVAASVTNTAKTTSASSAIFNGTWHKSSSSPSAYTNGRLTNLAYAGYTKGEYNFKADGTYTFQGESLVNSNDYRLRDENGTFSVNGNQLTITPVNSTYREVDYNGTIKRIEKLPLDKRTYTWKTHYYEGINETDLILAAPRENVIDGGFSSSDTFRNSFIYSPGKKLEFRFLPYKP